MPCCTSAAAGVLCFLFTWKSRRLEMRSGLYLSVRLLSKDVKGYNWSPVSLRSSKPQIEKSVEKSAQD